MNYSKAYFGKELHDLAYSDIEDYFKKQRKESDKIEFKAYAPGKGNIKEKWK